MIRLRASYEDEKDLKRLLEHLKPYLIRWKEKEQRGKSKRAYIDLDIKN